MKLFINYRRDDTGDIAGRLFDHLSREFGADNVFKDVDSIRPGQNWKAKLEDAVGSCDVVLALIGEGWVSCVDGQGNRRLASEKDYVRYELEAAQRNRREIMPVLVKGAKVPRVEDLPESLHWLPDLQNIDVHGDPHFVRDVAHLVKKLQEMKEWLSAQARQQAAGPAWQAPHDPGGPIACPGCRRLCPRTDQFCEHCGTGLWEICPRCKAQTLVGQRHCKTCGEDVPKARQTNEAYESALARSHDLGYVHDPAERSRQADALLADVEAAVRQAPTHAPLAGLRRQLRESATAAAREAAEAAFAADHLGPALHFYQRLLALAGPASEAPARIGAIRERRQRGMAEASGQIAQGGYKQASTVLATLRAAFPDDAEIKATADEVAGVLDRATALVKTGLRDLQTRRHLAELGREIDWLEAKGVRVQKLPELAQATRKKLAFADATAAEAQAALRAGNVRAAVQQARTVLEVVADHPAALEISRTTERVAGRIAEVEELVRLGRWCAADVLLRDLEAEGVSDPRLTRAGEEVESALRDVDFNIRMLVGVLFVAIAGWYYVVPRIDAASSPSGAKTESASSVIWLAGSALLLGITWWASGNKGQIVRRLASPLIPRAPLARPEAGPDARSTGPTIRFASTPLDDDGLIVEDEPTGPSGPHVTLGPNPGEPPPMSATEHHQRVEAAAVAAEWLVLGGAVSWLTNPVGDWLEHHLGRGWWTFPLPIALWALALVAAALYVGGFSRWRAALASGASFAGLVLCLSQALPLAWATILTLIGIIVYIGVLTAIIHRGRLGRGAAGALGGMAGALLLASPIVVGLLALANAALPPFSPKGIKQLVMPLGAAATIWCTLVALGSTASATLVRHFVTDRQAVRGLFALGLALATASGLVFLVLISTTILDKDSLWLTAWAVWLAAAQLVPPFLRWQGRPWFTISRAATSAATVAAVVLMEWLSPGSSLLAAAWVVACAAPILLHVRTIDAFSHRPEVLRRLRLRLRLRRLPVRLTVTRA